MLKRKNLCETLKKRALWTHKIIGQGFSSRLGVLEETITDVNLLEVEATHEGYVYTKKFSRKEEGAKSGADWLWCIGQPGSWLNLLVQAKIVSPFTGTCRYLNYRQGKQRSLLLRFARITRSVPIYVIYWHVPSSYEPSVRSRSEFAGLNRWEWGCSWLTPRQVRQMAHANRKNIEDVLAYGIPWAYPFCQSDADKRVLLGRAIAEGLAKGVQEFSKQSLSPGTMSAQHEDLGRVPAHRKIRWEIVNPTWLVQEEFPSVVRRLLSLRPGIRPPIAGLSVISATPLDDSSETRLLTRQEKANRFYPKVGRKR